MNVTGPNGTAVTVTSQGLMNVRAVTTSAAETLNQIGGAFRINGIITPAGGADAPFFYLENTGTASLVLSVIRAKCSEKTDFTTEIVSGTPVYTADAPAQVTNLNLGSSITLPAIANMAEDITGLTFGGKLSTLSCDVVDRFRLDDISSGIFIPQGKAVLMRRMATSGEVTIELGLGIQLIE